MLTPEQVRFFRDNGFLKVEGAFSPDEVAALRDATARLIATGPTADMSAGQRRDYQYGRVKGRDEPVLKRIEYLQGKGEPFLHLLAHPVLLDAVQKVVGEQFVPTWDSVVIKMPGSGVEVPWHRDGGGPQPFYDDPQSGRRLPAVNFDIYLDEANAQTGALYVIPGSNKDRENRAPELAAHGDYEGVPGAVMVPMQPGDLLLHDVTLYHGSPETSDSPSIRRVIYYEFRDHRLIDALHLSGPGKTPVNMEWTPEWVGQRLAVLQRALDERGAARGDVPFAQHPAPELRVPSDVAANTPTRVPHPGWDGAQ